MNNMRRLMHGILVGAFVSSAMYGAADEDRKIDFFEGLRISSSNSDLEDSKASCVSAGTSSLNCFDVSQPDCAGFKGKKVMCVDDIQLNCLMAEGTLGGMGMEVKTAFSGPDAIERCNVEAFDVVVTDLNMPGMDGAETAEHIKKLAGYSAVPVIVYTTEPKDPRVIEGLRTGVFQAWAHKKSGRPLELEAALKRVLGTEPK